MHELIFASLLAVPLLGWLLFRRPETAAAIVLLLKPEITLFLSRFFGDAPIKALIVNVVLLAGVTVYLIRYRRIVGIVNPVMYWTLLLGVWLFVGVTYSGQPEYGTFKATAYILENAFMVSLAALFYGDPDRIERFLKALAASGWLLGLIAGAWLLEAGFEMMGRLHPESYNPLQFARSVAMSIIGCFAVFLIRYRRGEFRPTALAFVPVGLGLMLLSGGKGPLLSLVASLIVLIFLAQKTRSLAVRALRMGAILLVLAAGAVAAFPFLPVAVQERLMPTLSQTAYAGSIGARIDRMAHGWRMFREAPILGHGTGSFVFGGQIGDYPHNILLELLSENGLIGLFLWTGLLCVGLLAVHRGIRSQTRLSSVAQPTAVATAAVTALLVLSIVAAMFSFNIVGNSSIWFFLGMLYMRHPGCGAVRTVHRGEQDLTACAPKLTGPVAPEAIAGVHVL